MILKIIIMKGTLEIRKMALMFWLFTFVRNGIAFTRMQYSVLIYFEVTDLSDEVLMFLKKCIYSFKACCILCQCVLCFELHCKYGKVKITVYKFFQDQVQNIFLISMVTFEYLIELLNIYFCQIRGYLSCWLCVVSSKILTQFYFYP